MSSPLPLQWDVVIVGAGAAGLYTALCLPTHLRVGVLTKESVSLSASDWAQGGIAAVIAPDDSTELHIQDTLNAGAGLCDSPAVRFLVEQASQCIENLVQMGVGFDRHHNTLALTLEAAHSRRRVLHAADTTGRAVVSTLAEQVLQCDHIQVIQQALTLDLWLENGHCQGVCVAYQGQIHWIRASAVILATGGGGQVFAQTTNPTLSTGDGVAIAHRAGAVLRDLEFVQFHPTALITPGAPRFLISEAVRGEGAHLVNAEGRRFAFDYDPAGELAPRDVVSRSIFRYLQRIQADPTTGHVYLDLRVIPEATLKHRFPNIMKICQHWGIDVMQQPIPVAPAAHYWMGGIGCDERNQTSIPGLYAVGETASTGVHGANRLASNSLLECLVFGGQFAHFNLSPLGSVSPSQAMQATIAPLSETDRPILTHIRQELPRLVWNSAGICRDAASMQTAIAQIQTWQAAFDRLSMTAILQKLSPGVTMTCEDIDLRLWSETRNLLAIAHLILKSAAFRTESRGGHYRTDYPETSTDWQVHTVVQGDRWSTAPVL